MAHPPKSPTGASRPDHVLREGVALESAEATAAAGSGFRQMVTYFARRDDDEALRAPLSQEAGLAEQVAIVLAICAARGMSVDRVKLRAIYDFVFGMVFRRSLVLGAVTNAAEALAASNGAALESVWAHLYAELVELDDAFRVVDAEKMKTVLKKTRVGAKGAGRFSPAKAAAALCIEAHALDAEQRDGDTVDKARTRIAKSFRHAAPK